MRIRPGGAELLRVARATLAERIVPALPLERLETVAAIERAMAVGEAKLACDDVATQAELAALETARVTMRDAILRALPAERRYDARLVSKAIAIGANQLAKGNDGEIREAKRLAELLGAPVPALGSPDAVRCGLTMLNERLAAHIRSGAADAGSPTNRATLAHLEAITREALSESNPTFHRLAPSAAAASCEPAATPAAIARVKASVAAWRDVPRTLLAEVATQLKPVPVAKRLDSWFRCTVALGEAFSVSGNAAAATQADLFGYVALRAAGNPNVPMYAVEGAHQLHDLSVAFADTSSAFFACVLAPFRILGGIDASKVRR